MYRKALQILLKNMSSLLRICAVQLSDNKLL